MLIRTSVSARLPCNIPLEFTFPNGVPKTCNSKFWDALCLVLLQIPRSQLRVSVVAASHVSFALREGADSRAQNRFKATMDALHHAVNAKAKSKSMSKASNSNSQALENINTSGASASPDQGHGIGIGGSPMVGDLTAAKLDQGEYMTQFQRTRARGRASL